MAQMRIDEVTPSKSGKAWRVKSGGQWYGAFGDSGIEKHVGKTIEAEITTSEKYGLGIAKYKVIEASTPPASVPTGVPRGIPDVAPWWMPYASNVCAHAIQAGYIKEPEHLKAWVLAAKEAAEGASKNDINF